jgi:hypothetical protein
MIQLPFRAVKQLEAARYWIDTRRWSGLPWLATGLTDPELTKAMTCIQENEERIAALKDVDITKPEKLMNLKNWQAFWEKWDNYMGQVYGAANIPLQYVYRGHNVVTTEMRNRPYETDEQERMAMAVLDTNHYQLDNKRVWNEFKPLVVDGSGWLFIKSYENATNGGGAVLDLWSQNQGENSQIIRKQTAYARLATLRFQGPRKSWTFSQYIKEHQTQHNELADCKEPVPESKKVTDFLSGISDSSLGNGLAHVYGDHNLLTNFNSCQKYLQTIAASTQVHQLMQGRGHDREVSSTGRDGGKGKLKGGKRKQVRHNEYISPDNKWKKMSRDERSAIFTKCEKDDDNGKGYKKQDRGKDKARSQERTTSSAGTDNAEEAEDVLEPDKQSKSAGHQFGKPVHSMQTRRKAKTSFT